MIFFDSIAASRYSLVVIQKIIAISCDRDGCLGRDVVPLKRWKRNAKEKGWLIRRGKHFCSEPCSLGLAPDLRFNTFTPALARDNED